MAETTSFQDTRGTALATFTQTGTYSNVIDMGGMRITALYSDNFPSAAGSITFRSSWSPTGTGYPVQTNDGTALKVLAFGSGTFYQFGEGRFPTTAMHYITMQIGTAGTTGVAAGGTIVVIGEA
jgi:hypothetical protein